MSERDQGYAMQNYPWTGTSNLNAMTFLIEQILGKQSHVAVVQVKSVTTTGLVAPIGQVSVQVLTKMSDNLNNTMSHGTINDLPYFRYQGGGNKAIILDPKVGDIGIAVFADRDISAVKANKKESTPGSKRRFDMADGLFIGCFISEEAPKVYIRFTDDDKIIASPDEGVTLLTIEKDKITAAAGTEPMEFLTTPTHVQMKMKGFPDMHLTINKLTMQVQAGQALTIVPDPFPAD